MAFVPISVNKIEETPANRGSSPHVRTSTTNSPLSTKRSWVTLHRSKILGPLAQIRFSTFTTLSTVKASKTARRCNKTLLVSTWCRLTVNKKAEVRAWLKHPRNWKSGQMANGAHYLPMQPHATIWTRCPPVQVNTSLMYRSRTNQEQLTVNRRHTTGSHLRSLVQSCRSNLQKCTKSGKEARQTSLWRLFSVKTADQPAVQVTCHFSTTSKAISHSEHERSAEAHNATLLMSKSNSLGLLHSSKSQSPSHNQQPGFPSAIRELYFNSH